MYKTIANMNRKELQQFMKQIATSPLTLELAERVANLPPENLDEKGIQEWAEKLSLDISKGKD
jgi:hypothetical protein